MKNDLKKAVLATVPVLTGYLVLGFGFGILMRSAGFGIGLSVAMSLMVYAGSMQYAAVGLLGGGASLVTALTRFLPFLLWGGGRSVPKPVERLGRVLPCAIMGMLVVYCLKGVELSSLSGWVPSLIACVVVGALHVWKRNTLLSILGGTVCYMVLVQTVF